YTLMLLQAFHARTSQVTACQLLHFVTPAKAGAQWGFQKTLQKTLDPGLRRGDGSFCCLRTSGLLESHLPDTPSPRRRQGPSGIFTKPRRKHWTPAFAGVTDHFAACELPACSNRTYLTPRRPGESRGPVEFSQNPAGNTKARLSPK